MIVPKDKPGLLDIYQAIQKISLPLYLANSDIRQRYRRSTLGPFWITISTGIMIATIGVIFGKLFKSPMSEFLPFLSVGLILWAFISSVISDSTNVFVNAVGIIRQLPIPLFTHVIRMCSGNLIILGHNLLILPIVYYYVGKGVTWNFFYFFPGLIILIANLLWISLMLGIICTRFRDLTQIVNSFLQILFYVTPIIWLPSLLPARADILLLDPNPLYHLIEVVRAPLLGGVPTPLDWTYTVLLAIGGWCLTVKFFNVYRDRVPYWL